MCCVCPMARHSREEAALVEQIDEAVGQPLPQAVAL